MLYVALTRARDTLLLSGVATRNPGAGRRGSTPRWPPRRRCPRRGLRGRGLSGAPAAPAPELPEVDAARVSRALGRLERPPPLGQAPVPLSLEALEDVASCPRRYRLRWVEGHRERPGRGGSGAVSPRHRDAAPSLTGQLLAALPPEAWRSGVPDAVAAPALARLGLGLGEGQALGILPMLRRLAPGLAAFEGGVEVAHRAAAAAGARRPSR